MGKNKEKVIENYKNNPKEYREETILFYYSERVPQWVDLFIENYINLVSRLAITEEELTSYFSVAIIEFIDYKLLKVKDNIAARTIGFCTKRVLELIKNDYGVTDISLKTFEDVLNSDDIVEAISNVKGEQIRRAIDRAVPVFTEDIIEEGEAASDSFMDNLNEKIWHKQLHDKLEEKKASLHNNREVKVLNLRFEKEMFLDQVGDELGVTRERIRQIEAKALRKLRHPSRARELKCFLHPEDIKSEPRKQPNTPKIKFMLPENKPTNPKFRCYCGRNISEYKKESWCSHCKSYIIYPIEGTIGDFNVGKYSCKCGLSSYNKPLERYKCKCCKTLINIKIDNPEYLDLRKANKFLKSFRKANPVKDLEKIQKIKESKEPKPPIYYSFIDKKKFLSINEQDEASTNKVRSVNIDLRGASKVAGDYIQGLYNRQEEKDIPVTKKAYHLK